MSHDDGFRAVLKRSFEVTGRGTVLSIDILEGKVVVGDKLVVPTADGRPRVVEVLAVDFLDIDLDRPTFRAEVALWVGDIRPSEVTIGHIIRSA